MSRVFEPMVDMGPEATSDICHGSRVSSYLRWAGVIILALAVLDFLVQGLRELAPAYRNWIIPGGAVSLAALGLLCGYAWKESKGARVFFGLATALFPVQGAQLGSMMVDLLHTSHDAGWREDYPGVALNMLMTSVVFVPVAYTGFRMLARQHASQLLCLTVLGSVSLILPGRDALPTTLVIGMLWLGLHAATWFWWSRETQMETLESSVAMAFTWLAPGILVSRALFYPMAALPISFAAMLLGLSLISRKKRIFGFSQGLLGGALAAIGWLSFVDTLVYASYLHAEHQFLVSILPLSMLLLITAEREADEVMRNLGAAGACVSVLVNLWNHPGHDAALLALLAGAGVALAGYQQRRKAVFVIGLSGSILGLGYYLRYAIDFYQTNSWLSLGLAGIFAILLASYLDRPEHPLVDRLRRCCLPTQGWL